MLKRTGFLIALIVVLSAVAYSQTTLDTALNFSVKDVHGETIELFDILDQDKIAVIDFYRTDCSYCNIYAPSFQEAFEAFGCNTSNVYFYTIDQGHYNAEVLAFMNEHSLGMRGASGLEGNGNEAFELYGVLSTPTMVVIKPNRVIHSQHIWPPETDSIIQQVESAGGIQAACATSIERPGNNTLTLYPNPAQHYFSVQGLPSGATIEVFDYTGRKVLVSNQSENISVTGLKRGIYFVTFHQGNRKTFTARLIVK